MALSRKYANLPDLDSAPDTYETPSLTDDNSTAPTGRPRSDSDVSSYKDFDDEEETSGISRTRLNADQARTRFLPAQIDARDVDFSDRVNAKRKSYKSSTRRQQRNGDDAQEYGDFSDEDGESLERKLARLRREAEEVREEYARRQAERKDTESATDVEADVAALSEVLNGVASNGEDSLSTYNEFAKNLGTHVKANGTTTETQTEGTSSTYTVTYAPTYQQSHALAKAADFDERLTMLERSLGLSGSDLPTASSKAIIPSLDTLSQQLLLLTTTTPSSLDNISHKVRTLTKEAERLEEKRSVARKAKEDDLKRDGVVDEDEEDSEQSSKINALYGTLSTIESLSPVLPLLLDRLRSLRAIHADAAAASKNLDKVEQRQIEQAEEIKQWKVGLEKVEEAIKNSEGTMSGNVKTVEGWVKELEGKIARL